MHDLPELMDSNKYAYGNKWLFFFYYFSFEPFFHKKKIIQTLDVYFWKQSSSESDCLLLSPSITAEHFLSHGATFIHLCE